MQPEMILGIIGVFISLGLGVNAFFVKGLYDTIKAVQINVAQLVTKAGYTDAELENLKNKHHSVANSAQKSYAAIEVMKSENLGIAKRIDTSENNQRDIFYRLHKLETKDKS